MKRWIASAFAGAVLIVGGGLVQTGTVGFYSGLNKGMTWMGHASTGEAVGCGFEIVGEPGFFCDSPEYP
jgi:hypothetical protein